MADITYDEGEHASRTQKGAVFLGSFRAYHDGPKDARFREGRILLGKLRHVIEPACCVRPASFGQRRLRRGQARDCVTVVADSKSHSPKQTAMETRKR